MRGMMKLLAGAAGVAALGAVAVPAAAQSYGYYPPYQTPGNVLGQVLNGVLGQPYGYNNRYYGVDQRYAVDQCTRAVEMRMNGNGYGYGGAYGGRYGYNGYNQNYGARVTAITSVEPRNNGALRVHGIVSRGGQAYGYDPRYGGGYGYNNGYDRRYYGDQQRFSCRVDNRGRVVDVNFDRY